MRTRLVVVVRNVPTSRGLESSHGVKHLIVRKESSPAVRQATLPPTQLNSVNVERRRRDGAQSRDKRNNVERNPEMDSTYSGLTKLTVIPTRTPSSLSG